MARLWPPQRAAWRGWARFFTNALASLVLLIALAVVSLFVYPSTRPPTRTVRPLGTISVDVPFRFTRAFIDYMTLEGPTLYVAFASHDLVGLIDTRAKRGIGAVGQLRRAHGIALVPELNLAFTSNGGDNTIGVFDLAHHQLVGFLTNGAVFPWRFKHDREVTASARLATNSSDAQREAALAGVGLVQTFAFYIADELARGRLEIVLADHERPPRQVNALYARNRAALPKIRVFLDWAQTLIAAHAHIRS